jgi:hypothetical protein
MLPVHNNATQPSQIAAHDGNHAECGIDAEFERGQKK